MRYAVNDRFAYQIEQYSRNASRAHYQRRLAEHHIQIIPEQDVTAE
jgi:hypothetical protein